MKATKPIKIRLTSEIAAASANAQDRKANLSLLLILALGILAYFSFNASSDTTGPKELNAMLTAPEAPRGLTLAERLEEIDHRTAQLEWVVDRPNMNFDELNRSIAPVRSLITEVKVGYAQARAEGDTESKEALNHLSNRLSDLRSRSTALASLH